MSQVPITGSTSAWTCGQRCRERKYRPLLVKWRVGVEKVTELTLVSMNRGTYKQNRVPDELDRHTRRLAAYDGTTPPFGVAVLLLPHRRSGSREPSVTFDRPTRQL